MKAARPEAEAEYSRGPIAHRRARGRLNGRSQRGFRAPLRVLQALALTAAAALAVAEWLPLYQVRTDVADHVVATVSAGSHHAYALLPIAALAALLAALPRAAPAPMAGSERPEDTRPGAAGSEPPEGARPGAAGSEPPEGARPGAAKSGRPEGARPGAAGSDRPEGARPGRWGRWGRALPGALALLGLAALAIALLVDLPAIHRTGLLGSPVTGLHNARTVAAVGLYLETLGAIALLAAGAAGLVVAPTKPRARSRSDVAADEPSGS